MDWRLFFSTFALIFFAELGDKTQLAAMASAAGHRSPLSIFLGASLALVCSTLIAVVVGSTLQRFIPINVIKIVAAVLFLVFGALLLVNALQGEKTKPEKGQGEQEAAQVGFLGRLAMEAAVQFEEAAADDYGALVLQCENPELRDLFASLASEEREHLHAMRHCLEGEHQGVAVKMEEVEEVPRYLRSEGGLAREEKDMLQKAMRHESAKSAFYHELARTTLLTGPRSVFQRLAREEEEHYRRLEKMEASQRSGEPGKINRS